MATTSATSASNPPNEKEEISEECTICLQNCFIDKGTLKCKHSFCFGCIEGWSKHENTCPLCKVRFTYIERLKAPKDDTTAPTKSKSSKKSTKKSKSEKVRIKRKSQGDPAPSSDIRLVPFFPHPMVSAIFAANFFADNFRGHEFDWATDEDDEDYMDDADDYDYSFMESQLPINVFESDEDDEDDTASYRQRLMSSTISNHRQQPPSVIDLTEDSPNGASRAVTAVADSGTEPQPSRNLRKRRHETTSGDHSSSSSSSSSSSQLPVSSSSSSSLITAPKRVSPRRNPIIPIAYEENSSSSSSSSSAPPEVTPQPSTTTGIENNQNRRGTRLLRSTTTTGRSNRRMPTRTMSLPTSSTSSSSS